MRRGRRRRPVSHCTPRRPRDRAGADAYLDWLAAHRTAAGSAAGEGRRARATRVRRAAGVATAATVLLALAAQEQPLPVPPG
ncbi:hypothetical protein ACU686_04835 [Yinghuangia aomiensis]